MPRLAHLLVALATLATLAMTSTPPDEPVTTTTVVGQDRCDGSDLVLAEHDACSWTMTTTTSEDAAPMLEIRLSTAAAGDGIADGAIVVWSTGDCGFFLDHDSGVGADAVLPAASKLHVGCGERTVECIEVAGSSHQCDHGYEQETDVPVARGTLDGHDLVWTFVFEGDLAEWADVHDRGSTLRPGLSSIGPRVPGTLPLAGFTCGTDTPCFDYVGDFIFGRTPHAVG